MQRPHVGSSVVPSDVVLCLDRYAGLDCHLILRNSGQAADSDPGLVGNLLIDRMTGAHIHQVRACCLVASRWKA